MESMKLILFRRSDYTLASSTTKSQPFALSKIVEHTDETFAFKK